MNIRKAKRIRDGVEATLVDGYEIGVAEGYINCYEKANLLAEAIKTNDMEKILLALKEWEVYS